VDIFIFICSDDIFIHMTEFVYKMDVMEEGRIRFIISLNEVEMGSLYFEKAKRGFTNKPVSMDAWVCVDSKVGGLYEVSNYDITPKQIVERCQSIIGESPLFGFGQPSVDSINEPTEE
jgi:hypothetical protein